MADSENFAEELNGCTERGDFAGALGIIRRNLDAVSSQIGAAGVRDALKRTTKDRLLLSYVDSVEFGARPLEECLVRLEKLLSLQVGTMVLSKSLEWGCGEIKRLDHFYRKITVDFRAKKGHQFAYAAAVDMLTVASPDHILVLQKADPVRFTSLLSERPGEFVKAALKSFGPMSVQRLEIVFTRCGFVKEREWKAFWERARAELKKDKLVYVPVKRTDPIELKASEENYGDGWLAAFSRETDPKLILAGVREYVANGGMKEPAEQARGIVGDRLAFAVTAARRVDDALYARLASLVTSLGFDKPSAAEMREYLWDRKRFINAAATLPAREVGELISFLAVDEAARAKICKAIPDLCYTAVQEIVSQFGTETDNTLEKRREVAKSRKLISDLMRLPKAPATLTTLLVGSYQRFEPGTRPATKEEIEYSAEDKVLLGIEGKAGEDGQFEWVARTGWWQLPPFISLLTHAIALGEGRQNGETLKMQNIVRRLFAQQKSKDDSGSGRKSDGSWLEKAFAWLGDDDKALFFERFQASIAWDPSTHHAIVMRMIRLVPNLESHLVKIEKKKEYARVTSHRSYMLRKAEYLKLINKDMPENVRKIEEAKSYGDLSENAEYQYAKDEQRVLMQKQSVMQADLEAVKETDFSDATTDEVMPGVSVTVESDGSRKKYIILGEWDNDQERGVISSRTRLATNMLGKKVGDQFELPGADDRTVFAKILAIEPLSAEIRSWMSEEA